MLAALVRGKGTTQRLDSLNLAGWRLGRSRRLARSAIPSQRRISKRVILYRHLLRSASINACLGASRED